jgi:hypothetical protein
MSKQYCQKYLILSIIYVRLKTSYPRKPSPPCIFHLYIHIWLSGLGYKYMDVHFSWSFQKTCCGTENSFMHYSQQEISFPHKKFLQGLFYISATPTNRLPISFKTHGELWQNLDKTLIQFILQNGDEYHIHFTRIVTSDAGPLVFLPRLRNDFPDPCKSTSDKIIFQKELKSDFSDKPADIFHCK